MGNYLTILEEKGYFLVTIDRPKQLNALNRPVLEELRSWLAEQRDSRKTLIITGSGDKAFVAGADIAAMKDMSPQEAAEFSHLGQSVFAEIYEWPLPTIAAINGYALGGGCELALACDLRYMKKTTRIGQPEVGLGIIPGFGGTYFLKKVVGEALAKELIFTGRQVDGVEAERLGLVSKALSEEGFLENVIELVKPLIEGSRSALATAKEAMNEVDILKELGRECRLFADLFAGPDQKEGMDAFLARRKPRF